MRPVNTRIVTFALLAVTLSSSNALAQRGGGGMGGGGGRRGGSESGGAGFMMSPKLPPSITSVVMDKAKDLELTDAQRTSLEALRASQDSANEPWKAKLDSMRPVRMPANGPNDMSQEQRDEMEGRRAQVASIMEVVREVNAQSRIKVMAVLKPDQQKRVAEFEEEAIKKADDEAKQRARMDQNNMRSRGGMGGRPETH